METTETTEKIQLIGRVVATEKKPTTMEEVTFWTNPELILNPFDIVKIEHLNDSHSYAVIEDISHITDASSFLTNYISSDFGDVNVEEATIRVGMNYVGAKVIHNNKGIYTPLLNNQKVLLATAEEIIEALGLDDVENPFTCGYLEMYESTTGEEKVVIPVNLNSKFIIGPEGAHLNISGISGLAAKTSYAMFLLKSIQETFMKREKEHIHEEGGAEEESVAFVIFNVKGQDLLTIDQKNDFTDERNPKKAQEQTEELYKTLGLDLAPFENVKYHFPRCTDNLQDRNSFFSYDKIKERIGEGAADMFAYIYEEDRENLDLLFSNIDDPNQTIDAIINYIISGDGDFGKKNSDWEDFLEAVNNKSQAGNAGSDKSIPVVSWRKFERIVRKALTKGGDALFVNSLDSSRGEVRLGESLKKIQKNEVHVIDIAKLDEEKQAFVFGDAVRQIYNLRAGQYDGEDGVNPPTRIVIFIDELNKYASKDLPKNSPILRQILELTERGRSQGLVLFGAEQFRSGLVDRVTGNCSTHAYGRTNSIEIAKGDYKSIPTSYKSMMTRLKQGEYIVQNPIFRSLLRIKFPKPVYKQIK